VDEQLAALCLAEYDAGLGFTQRRSLELARRREVRASVEARAALRPIEEQRENETNDERNPTAPLELLENVENQTVDRWNRGPEMLHR